MIRRATLSDLPDLIRMAADMLAESEYRGFDVDPARFEHFCGPLITHGFAAVSETDGRVNGALLGDVITPWFSTKRMGVEYAVYIEPAHRSGLKVARMVNQWAAWCQENKAIQCRLGISTGNFEAARLYEALGFRRCGNAFIKDL